MIDSETWRLLLQHYGIAYEEEPHAFRWGSILALFRAGLPAGRRILLRAVAEFPTRRGSS
jgi:hypothetical protein